MEDITVVKFGRQGRCLHTKGLVTMIVQILPTRIQNTDHKYKTQKQRKAKNVEKVNFKRNLKCFAKRGVSAIGNELFVQLFHMIINVYFKNCSKIAKHSDLKC